MGLGVTVGGWVFWRNVGDSVADLVPPLPQVMRFLDQAGVNCEGQGLSRRLGALQRDEGQLEVLKQARGYCRVLGGIVGG